MIDRRAEATESYKKQDQFNTGVMAGVIAVWRYRCKVAGFAVRTVSKCRRERSAMRC